MSDIDDEQAYGNQSSDPARREEEEEERIERERLARLRLQAQRSQSTGSAPPESPVVGQAPSWGAPPPVPPHAAAGAATADDSDDEEVEESQEEKPLIHVVECRDDQVENWVRRHKSRRHIL